MFGSFFESRQPVDANPFVSVATNCVRSDVSRPGEALSRTIPAGEEFPERSVCSGPRWRRAGTISAGATQATTSGRGWA